MTATNAKAAEDDSFATIDDANLIEIGWKLCLPAIDAGDIEEGEVESERKSTLPTAEEISARVALYEAVEPFPVLSVSYPDLSVATAYDVQADYVAGLEATGHGAMGLQARLDRRAKTVWGNRGGLRRTIPQYGAG